MPAGSTIPVRQARPAVVELDDLFGMFDAKTRVGQQRSLDGFGGGLAGRGQDINTAIEAFVPLLRNLEPVARNLSDPDTRLDRFFASLARAAEEVAPVAEEQASLFVNLDTAFTALATIARPYLQETISESPLSEQVAIRDFPRQRPFIRNNTAFFRELRPGVAVLPHAAPILADAFEAGTKVLPRTVRMNEDLADVFEALAEFGDDPMVRAGIDQLTRLSSSLRPTLRFITPAQTTCNYASLFIRNVASVLSEGDQNGNYQRFLVVSAPTDPITFENGPNNEAGPSEAPARGPGRHNYLHANMYPNTAAPGQERECEAGNERLRDRPDRDRQHARQPGPHHGGAAMRRGQHGSRFTPYQVGLIALLVIVVGAYLGFSKDIPFTTPFQLKAVFENAPPIYKGQAVRIAGVEVGKVSAVEPKGGDSPAVVVTMKLKDEALPIHRNAQVKVRPRLFFEGNLFFDIRPGTPSSGNVKDGDTIPVSQTSAPVQLDQVLGTLQTDTREDLQKLLVGYGDAINGEPQPGEDDDQDPDTRGETAGKALNDSYEYSADALRGGAVLNDAPRARSCTTSRS